MANDLIIGGSTYKNIDYVQIRRADGTIAVYYDRNRIDNRVMTASCTKVDGSAYAVAATGLDTDSPDNASVKSVAGGSYDIDSELQLDNPQASLTEEEI